MRRETNERTDGVTGKDEDDGGGGDSLVAEDAAEGERSGNKRHKHGDGDSESARKECSFVR
jgi:hypothetical protein